jgi:hypothetical protein
MEDIARPCAPSRTNFMASSSTMSLASIMRRQMNSQRLCRGESPFPRTFSRETS